MTPVVQVSSSGDSSVIEGSDLCISRAMGYDNSYIQLNFTSTVSLTYMRARGSRPASSFRLEVQDESANFNTYAITSEPTVSMVFYL